MKRVLKQAARSVGITRLRLAAARMCCERHVLASLPLRGSRNVGRILCYHAIGQPAWGVNDLEPERFRRQLELALSQGFRFVPAADLVRGTGGPRDLAITFDDGLRTVETVAAPILKDYRIPWSLFVVSDWAEKRGDWEDAHMLDWRAIERLAGEGVEIGSHSVTHPDFSTLEPSRIVDELGESRRAIEQRLGITAQSFAIPYGQSANWPAAAAAAAREAGYSVVYAQAEDTRPPDTVARTFVTKFDSDRVFRALLRGAYDGWEEWV